MKPRPRPIQEPAQEPAQEPVVEEKPATNRLAELEAKHAKKKAAPTPTSTPVLDVDDLFEKARGSVRLIDKAVSLDDINARLEDCRLCSFLTWYGCSDCGTCTNTWGAWRKKLIRGNCKRFSVQNQGIQIDSQETYIQFERNEPMPANAPTEPGQYWATINVPRNAVPPNVGPRMQDGMIVQTTEDEIAAADATVEGYNAIVDLDGEAPFLSLRQVMLTGQQGVIRTPRPWRIGDITSFGPRIDRPTTV